MLISLIVSVSFSFSFLPLSLSFSFYLPPNFLSLFLTFSSFLITQLFNPNKYTRTRSYTHIIVSNVYTCTPSGSFSFLFYFCWVFFFYSNTLSASFLIYICGRKIVYNRYLQYGRPMATVSPSRVIHSYRTSTRRSIFRPFPTRTYSPSFRLIHFHFFFLIVNILKYYKLWRKTLIRRNN